MLKADWGTVNFDLWRVICTIEGHEGKTLLSETNGDKALALAMRNALGHAKALPEDIGHVNAHGVSTRLGDEQEAQAILETFGCCGETVPVFEPKSYFGNLGAGTGAVELIASILALEQGTLPCTLNYETPDPNCPLNVVANQPQPIDQASFLNLNVTRVGQASCLMVRRHESY